MEYDFDAVPGWNRSEPHSGPEAALEDDARSTLEEAEAAEVRVVPVEKDGSVVSVWRLSYAVPWKMAAVLTSLLAVASCLGLAGYTAWLHALHDATPSPMLWISLVVTATQPLLWTLALLAIRRVYLAIRTREWIEERGPTRHSPRCRRCPS